MNNTEIINKPTNRDNQTFLLLGIGFLLIASIFYALIREKSIMSYTEMIQAIIAFIVLFFPTWFGTKFIIERLNQKKVMSKTLWLRFTRNSIIAIIWSFISFFIYYAMREFYFKDSPDSYFEVERILFLFLINWLIIQFVEYYFFLIKERDELIQKEQAEKAILQLKHDMLKEQMNPHFLFNSLNVLSSLIFINQEKANQYTKELSKLYRYILNANRTKTVDIQEEIKFLNSYFHILKLRFNDAINLRLTQSKGINGKIVPLTLQLLVENAQKHNAFSQEAPLDIDIKINEREVMIINSLSPKSVNNSSKLGLAYLQKMYQDLGHHLTTMITDSSFSVRIPIIS